MGHRCRQRIGPSRQPALQRPDRRLAHYPVSLPAAEFDGRGGLRCRIDADAEGERLSQIKYVSLSRLTRAPDRESSRIKPRMLWEAITLTRDTDWRPNQAESLTYF